MTILLLETIYPVMGRRTATSKLGAALKGMKTMKWKPTLMRYTPLINFRRYFSMFLVSKKALTTLVAVFFLNAFVLTTGIANAQTTSTSLFGTGLTAPTGAQVLSGTAINSTTGQAVR